MQIGKSIKELREMRGLSQEELSSKIELDVVTFNHIEEGTVIPAQPLAEKICEVLDVPMAFLMLFGMEEKDVAPGREKIFNTLNPALKEFALEIIKK